MTIGQYSALSLSSLVVTVESARADEGWYSTSVTELTTVEQKEVIVAEERKIVEEEVWPEIPPPPITVTPRGDDWFVQLDVSPRPTVYVPPGSAMICCCFQETSLLCS